MTEKKNQNVLLTKIFCFQIPLFTAFLDQDRASYTSAKTQFISIQESFPKIGVKVPLGIEE